MEEDINLMLTPIKGNLLFQSIFKKSKKISNSKLAIYIVFRNNSNQGRQAEDCAKHPIAIKYAAMVKKKIVKKAVCRNKVKRLVRVSLRELLRDPANLDLSMHTQYVIVMWNSPLGKPNELKLSEVKQEIAELFARAKFSLKNYTSKPNENNPDKYN